MFKEQTSIVLPPPLNFPTPSLQNTSHQHFNQNQVHQYQKPVLLPPSNSNQQQIVWDYKLNPYQPQHQQYQQGPQPQQPVIQQQHHLQYTHQQQQQQQQPHQLYKAFTPNDNPISSSDQINSPSPIIPNFNNDHMLQSSAFNPRLPPINGHINTGAGMNGFKNTISNDVGSSTQTSPPSSSFPSFTSNTTKPAIDDHNKITKPRKKKQCPECLLFFSNLSTHKSTHLNPSSRPFQCQICGRGFSRSNDLFRHSKRHWKETGSSQGAFKCPFSTVLLKQLNPSAAATMILENDIPCHPSGIFSRCDTYKNHLKALHFEYPIGTKKKNRNGTSGNCKKCGKFFNNVDEWLSTHVNTNECGYHYD